MPNIEHWYLFWDKENLTFQKVQSIKMFGRGFIKGEYIEQAKGSRLATIL